MAGYEVLGSVTLDNLFAGTEIPALTKIVTILKGEGELKRGTLLGKQTIGAVTVAASGGGEEGANTGNGTCTKDATTPVLAGAQVGDYLVKIVTAAGDGTAAVAHVYDPKGSLIDIIEVATTPGTTFAKQIKFVIVDGTTPFVAGDGFKVSVAAGSGKYRKVNKTAVDGSAVAEVLLSHDVTVATDADSKAVAYKTGLFNRKALIVADGDTVDAHEEELAKKFIFLRDEQTDTESTGS